MLIVLAGFGEVPWWVPIAALLYDMTYPVMFMLPWMRKRFEAQAQRQKQIDMVMERLNPPRRDN